ncbi:4b0c5c29-b53a-4a42-a15f-3a191b5f48cd [Sclerotinia trifoliorum]|uniref:4b0c5c29-b53a-4a42-a15f-3a191b5f48cd n=1 Tax=Sclerotinia trifoliorum TaxID=28548 RepID=A0A8H2VWW0_9HELO|nr:4b0c5c29-b53a-4a42-a15f-3a191b5f48cd [Sclerotinia trifoliorum]
MALEVIGGIASIAQLAGTVYTISKTLYEVGEALSNAPSDINDLARDLETFSDELHLLSTLLHGKDGRYADQVYRLTAKIIGDCATICTKIDRIIRRLKSGNMWAKVKWLYKEKEIMKLLARLRDLKLSLMGTLSVLSALRADHMMDALGIQNSSLIGGQKSRDLSVETRKQVEDTKLKLAGLTMKDASQSCPASTTMVQSSVSLLSGSSSTALSSSATSGTYIGSAASRTPSTTSFATSAFISMAATPNRMPPLLNSRALESVDSFHSAMSSQNEDGESVKVWRNEMALSAVKHFKMEKKDAEEWAMRLPVPSKILSTTPHARKYGQLGTANNIHELGNDEDGPSSRPNSTPMDFQGKEDEDDSFDGYSPTSVGYSPIDGHSPESGALQTDAALTSALERKKDLRGSKRVNFFQFKSKSLTDDELPRMCMQDINTQNGNRNAMTSPFQQPPMTDYQTQLALLDEQNKKRLALARQEQEAGRQKLLGNYQSSLANTALPMSIHSDEHAQKDYQMQLMLLEEQNKKRLTMARQEQQDQIDHQRKLLLLEEQNKKRWMMSQLERHNHNLVLPSLTAHPQWQCQPPKTMKPDQRPATTTSGDNPFDGIKKFSVATEAFPLISPCGDSTAMPPPFQMFQQREVSQLHSQPYQQFQWERQQMNQQPSHQLHEIKQSQQVQIQHQESQQSHTSVNQPHYQPPNLMRKSEKFVASAAGQPAVVSGPAPEEGNNNLSTQPICQFSEGQTAFSHCQNEASDQCLGGLWSRALTNVKSFDQLIYGNLKRLLASRDLFITSATGSNPLLINPDWSAIPHKERIASYCRIFPRAATSIQRVLEILGVMEETIGIKIGAIAWASLLLVVEDLFLPRTKISIDSQIEIIAELAEIASIIARYTVMENIYAQWKGMTLENNYKESLINLSTHVLIYMGTLFSRFKDFGIDLDMKPYFHKIIEADTACRGFTVIFSSEAGAVDQKRSIGDMSDDSDDSDDTVLKGDGEIEMKDIHLPVKRMRI